MKQRYNKFKNYAALVTALCFVQSVFSQDTLYTKKSIWVGKRSNGVRNGYWQEYKNDTILSSGYFKNDVREGDWNYYGIDGGKDPEIAVVASGKYSNNKRVGEWEERQGLINSKGMYKNGLKQGLWNYYDLEVEGAPIILKGKFEQGVPEGTWSYYFVDEETAKTKVVAEGNMHNGCFEGEWKTYHWSSGNVCSRGNSMPNTAPTDSANQFDVFTFFRYLSQLMEYYNDAEVRKTGVWNYYHSQNQLDATGLYVNGKKEGEWVYYYENGNLKEKGVYGNGQKQGIWLQYDSDTTMVTARENFRNDTLQGSCNYVCRRSKTTIEGAYANGAPVGEWKSYYNDTILYMVCGYDGAFFPNYQEVDYLKQTGNLYDKNRHGAFMQYHTNGSISKEGQYVHGKKEGEWRSYASAGYVSCIENYKNDMLHGEYVYFNWYGKYVWQYGLYENGEKTKWVEYAEAEGMTVDEYLARINAQNKSK